MENLPNAKSDSTDLDDTDVLATAKAVRTARLANYTLINAKQASSSAVKFYLGLANQSLPNPINYGEGDMYYADNNGTYDVYLHDGTAWNLLT